MRYHTKAADKLPICPTVRSPPSFLYIQFKCGKLNNSLPVAAQILKHGKLL